MDSSLEGERQISKAACKIATLKDDGIISKEENKILAVIAKETDAYVKQLKKIL